MDRLDLTANIPSAGWLWNGYIARGSLTLLTSQWKAGKTTLLSGLLQRLGDGQPGADEGGCQMVTRCTGF